MNKEILVEVNNVSKKFCKDLKTSLRYGLLDSLNAILPIKKTKTNQLRKKEFWAVKNISFSLQRGECIGLIGHNGAGKSTLLKIINGLIVPDSGRIVLKGKIGALIELGAGFNPILTGKENIYNNAAILGFSKKEIDAKLQDIISFSEIEEFIDTPVQNYSSGMKMRLGFAVAVHLEPDILIIDEVLAVGDLGFVLKCFKSIDELLPNTAVIFVSHNMPMISRICNQIILMEKGQVKYQGINVSKGIDLYYSHFSDNDYNIVFDDSSIELIDYNISSKIKWNGCFELFIKLNIKKTLTNVPNIYLEIKDKEQRPIASILKDSKIKKGIIKCVIIKKNIELTKGVYSIDIGLYDSINKTPLFRINNFATFQVEDKEEMWVPFKMDANWSFE